MTTDRPQHSTPPWPRAADHSTHNPTVQQQRISDLLHTAAETLYGIGAKPQTRFRVLHMEQSNSGEAA